MIEELEKLCWRLGEKSLEDVGCGDLREDPACLRVAYLKAAAAIMEGDSANDESHFEGLTGHDRYHWDCHRSVHLYRRLSCKLSPAVRKWEAWERYMAEAKAADGRAVGRLSLRWWLEREAVDGRVRVVVWSRDCDCVEAAVQVSIPATLEAWEDLYERNSEEGPCRLTLLKAGDEDLEEPVFRDRVLEARENGSHYLV